MQNVEFSRSYDNVPTVLVSANHTANGGNLDPDFTGMCPWIEVCILLGTMFGL